MDIGGYYNRNIGHQFWQPSLKIEIHAHVLFGYVLSSECVFGYLKLDCVSAHLILGQPLPTFSRVESVFPQSCDKWGILTCGLHTSGRYRGRTKRSCSSIGPNIPDTWSADWIDKISCHPIRIIWQQSKHYYLLVLWYRLIAVAAFAHPNASYP